MKSLRKIFASTGLVFLLAGCPNGGLTDEDILRLNDTIEPAVSITSHADGDPYAPQMSMSIAGVAIDTATDAGEPGNIASCTYEVKAGERSGALELDSDGFFSFDIDTHGMTGNMRVDITAIDWNGNVGVASATLAAPKEITEFAFTAENNAELNEDAPGVIDGTDITVSIPYNIDVSGLIARFATTGELVEVNHSKQVSGTTQNDFTEPVEYVVTANDATTKSYVVSVSSAPTAPDLTGLSVSGPHTIALSWVDNAFNEHGYQVERKTGSGGTYAEVAALAKNQTTYSDSGLSPATEYYYRVRAHNSAGVSEWSNESGGMTLSFYLETVDSTGYVGAYTSLALDANGHPHMSYYDATNKALKYARFDGDEWVGQLSTTNPDTVDTSADVGLYTSIAIDADNHPHISYYDNTTDDLKYVHWNGSAWVGLASATGPDTVDSGGDVGQYSSLALDSNGAPHISYHDYSNAVLKYARWLEGSGWVGLASSTEPDIVDNSGPLGYYTSLAVDSDGRPHVSYQLNDVEDAIKYARWDGNGWVGQESTTQPDAVESGADIGYYTSLALDSSDSPHVAYIVIGMEELRYMHWNGVSWGGLAFAGGPDVLGRAHGETSVAMDANERPCIAYYGMDPALRYVRWDGSGWVGHLGGAEPDLLDNVGRDASLAIDANNIPHIGYYDDTTNSLKYARGVHP